MNEGEHGDSITIRGVLDLFSETGTEGGHWAVWDKRASHGPVDRCPWSEENPECPGTQAYWDRMPGDSQPESLAHGNYAGLWLLKNGQRLRVFEREHPERVLLDWTVRLTQQRDQYADDAKHAHGWVIHSYPSDVDLDEFSTWAHGQYPAVLDLRASAAAQRQDETCAELARLAFAAEAHCQSRVVAEERDTHDVQSFVDEATAQWWSEES